MAGQGFSTGFIVLGSKKTNNGQIKVREVQTVSITVNRWRDLCSKALALAGAAASICDVTAMTLAGLSAAHQQGQHADA